MMRMINDHFQNFKRYQIPRAQLVIADIPYNIGKNAYGSSPEWYVDGDNKNGESDKANSEFFDTDKDFRIMEFFHFCNKMVKKEPKGTMKALKADGREPGCMVVFCAFEQLHYVLEKAKQYGFPKYIPLVFRKKTSAQVLKANMRIVGNCEYGLVLYRDKLPKFRNEDEGGNKHMVLNCMDWPKSSSYPKIHPTQKPVELLERLIEIFTDEGDIVIGPVAGSGSTLIAAENLGRKAYGFEIKKDFVRDFNEKMRPCVQPRLLLGA